MTRIHVALLLCFVLAACSDSSDSGSAPVAPPYDFGPARPWLTPFVEGEDTFHGAGFIVISREHGVLYTQSFGTHPPDMIYLLASVSKVPSVSLLMALASDPGIDFDLDTPIENYLPWPGVYPGITTAQLLSNTSGIPGLLTGLRGNYGVHNCQYAAPGLLPHADNLLTCAQAIYQAELDDTQPPGTLFDYGGSQWQLAGAVAEVVGGDSWGNLFRQYIAEPCGLDVFEYGNLVANTSPWTGYPDSLLGRDNPNIEGGGISNLQDVATLLRMHLNDGVCGDRRIMDAALSQRMRQDVGSEVGSREWLDSGNGYGMGWWVRVPEVGTDPTLFTDGGAFGSSSWIDTERGYGVFVALAKYDDLIAARRGPARINPELIPIIEAILDNPL